jgi:hypothetical protein
MREIKKDLAAELDREALAEVGLAPLQTFVAARLTFHELIGIVLPRTRWTARPSPPTLRVGPSSPVRTGEGV